MLIARDDIFTYHIVNIKGDRCCCNKCKYSDLHIT